MASPFFLQTPAPSGKSTTGVAVGGWPLLLPLFLPVGGHLLQLLHGQLPDVVDGGQLQLRPMDQVHGLGQVDLHTDVARVNIFVRTPVRTLVHQLSHIGLVHGHQQLGEVVGGGVVRGCVGQGGAVRGFVG